MTAATEFAFACPRCAAALPHFSDGGVTCPECVSRYEYRDGIYRFMLPERLAEIQPFLQQYRAVREADGYRRRDSAYYRSLPQVNSDDPQVQVWRVRSQSFAHMLRRVLPKRDRPSLAVLDVGAGNCWLSHKLSALGHRCAAVDWLDDAEDGLGAHVHYPAQFVRAQADFDRLPLAAGQFDLVIFNASLHYSADARASLRHARRMLANGGQIVVCDSPMFDRAEDGEQMVREKHAAFHTHYGLGQVVSEGAGFLTFGELESTARDLGLEAEFTPSNRGWRQRLMELWRAARGRRAAAQFGVWVGAAGRTHVQWTSFR